ncbi:MAG: putative glutamine amidotransferase [Verrucomicrobiota bacterium]|jgi:putative glutamine amidotransferase
MKSPLILISGSTDDKGVEFDDFSLSLSMNYVHAILAAGGLPLLVPCEPDRNMVADAVQQSDGVLLTGGDDVDPKLYGAALPARVLKTVHRAHAARDAFELMLIEEVLRQRKALLCICRGHQILNVALGGSLIADIALQSPNPLNHNRPDRKDRAVHEVRCKAGSVMRGIAGKNRLRVNSSHHQAVGEIPQVLRATAVSNDGIVESLELAQEALGLLPYLLAVQFHPERLFRRHAEHLELFRSFIRSCRLRR